MAVSLSLAGYYMEKVVIIGAGVAGLACLNALLDCHVRPILIEAGKIGSNKICGEFLSLAACCQLETWGIGPIQKIDSITIESSGTKLKTQQKAGAMNRSEAEKQLAERAKSLGGTIMENTKIIKTSYDSVTLFDNTTIKAKNIIIATGALGPKPKDFPYIGLKAHFLHDSYKPNLEMHLFKGGYFGIVPISTTTSNIACLVKESAKAEALVQMNKELAWLTAPVGSFGMKKVPIVDSTYYIGDAIASLPPAIGGGFGHAINSAILCAKHLVHDGSSKEYLQELRATLSTKMILARLINQIMLSPIAANFTLKLLQNSPKLQNRLLHHIGL